MSETVTLEVAEEHFEALVLRAEAGEEILIERDGKPVAKLVSFKSREQATPEET